MGLVSACAGAFQCGLCGCSVVGLGALGEILGVFLVHCVLCCAGDSDSACLRELMNDGTSSPYIFLLMLLLIPFLVIDLSIKAKYLFNLLRREAGLRDLDLQIIL